MTPDEQEELDRLCRTVVDEKNSAKLTEAVTTLNEFLEERERKKPNPGPQEDQVHWDRKQARELCYGCTVHFDSPDRETQTFPLWHQHGAKNAPTAVRAMWESDCLFTSLWQSTPKPTERKSGYEVSLLLFQHDLRQPKRDDH